MKTMKRKVGPVWSIVVLAGWLVGAVGAFGASPWYVATNGASPWNGGSWASAYTNLQQAIDSAVEGDTIYVAGHTFSNNTTVQLQSQLVWTNKGLTILGGYAADGGTPGALGSTPTVLSQPGNGTSRILYLSGVTNGSVQRVTITGGNLPSSYGGAMYLSGCSNLSFGACLVTNNQTAAVEGGGIYVIGAGGYVRFTNCVVQQNACSGGGGGGKRGGGLRIASGTVRMDDSVLARNRITPSANTDGSGAGAYVDGTLILRDCLVYGNEANWETVPYAVANSYGDGLCLNSGTLLLQNCTVAHNLGEGIRRTAGTVAVSNSIVWGNFGKDIVGVAMLASCDVLDGTSNGVNGCFSADPLFQNGYYLSPSSPCVNTGNVTAAAVGLDARTTRTDATPDGGVVDLGYHYVTGFDITYADVYVATNGDNLNNGTNALTPFKTITKALATAVDGTRIHLASGSYATNTETFPLAIMGKTGVQLLGTNRDTTFINAVGANQRVLTLQDAAGSTRIEGLTITGGNPTDNGGALYLELVGDLTLSSCVITNNSSKDKVFGMGLYSMDSSLTITNCRIEGNFSSASGGGGKYGAGICAYYGSLSMRDCTLMNNKLTPSPSTTSKGGGLYLNGGIATLRDCLVSGNDANYNSSGSTGLGDGLYLETAPGVLRVENCTVADNIGSGVYQASGVLSVSNSIVWANTDDIYGSVLLAYSDIKDGDSNGVNGCFSSDPLFQSGYYLAPNSPCVNTGSVTAVAAGVDGRTTQTAGTPDSGTVDLGYHYASGYVSPYPDLYVATNGDNAVNSGTNAASPFKTIGKALATAVDSTRIHIAAGTYGTNTETFPLTLSSRNSVQLLGAGRDLTVINAAGASQRVLTLQSLTGSTRIEGLTFTGAGTGGNGGALSLDTCAAVTLASCAITNNTTSASSGGGIYALSSGLSLTNCRVERNFTASGGGNNYGGGIRADATSLTLQDCTLINNKLFPSTDSGGYGGAVYLNGGTAVLRDCLLYGNDANYNGSHSAGYGDGVYLAAGSMLLNQCTLAYNVGSGVYLGGGDAGGQQFDRVGAQP